MKSAYRRIVGILHFGDVAIIGIIFLLKLFHIYIFQVFIITHDSRILLVVLLGSRTFYIGNFSCSFLYRSLALMFPSL